MRIQRREQPAHDAFPSKLRGWIRHGPGSTRLALYVVLVAALAVVVSVWFGVEGHHVLTPWLQGLPGPTRAAPEALANLHLEIQDREYQALALQREGALREGSQGQDSAEWLEARLLLEGEVVPAEIRLGGDSAAHWRQDKWTLQVRTQGDSSLMGMRLFSLQSPATQGYLNGWLYAEALRRADIVAPRVEFVNLAVNDADWGAYALVEVLSEEMLRAQGRGSGILARFEGDLPEQRPEGVDASWAVDADPVVVASDGVADHDTVRDERRDTVIRLLRAFQRQQMAPAEVFEAQAMGRYLAHANLWGARSGLTWRNQRYYYNPATLWLEPVASEGQAPSLNDPSRFDLAVYDDPEIMEAYAQEALIIARPEYLDGLKAAYEGEFERLRAALQREFDLADLTPPWTLLAERQAMMSAALHPPQPVHAYWRAGSGAVGDPASTSDLLVANLAPYPVMVDEVRAGERAVDAVFDWVPEGEINRLHQETAPSVVLRRAEGNVPQYVTLRIPSSAIQQLIPGEADAISGTLQVVAHVVGVQDSAHVVVREDAPPAASVPVFPPQPTLEEALERYPFLTLADEPNFLELEPGTWHVNGDLVLPDGVGLMAARPATLEFDRSALLFATGPLLLHGPTEGSIRLVPKEDYWAGLFVLRADHERASELFNVEIVATAGIERAGWSAESGATFQESPVTLAGLRVEGSAAESALRVVGTSFELGDSEFADISGDAFDADSAQGTIRRTTFRDILGTAIDVAAGDVHVEDTEILRTLGAGIHAGRTSSVAARGIRADNVSSAVSSTYGSHFEGADIRVAQASIAGFTAYGTGSEELPSSIEAEDVVFEDDISPRALAQEGCRVSINGVEETPSGFPTGAWYTGPAVPPEVRATNYTFGTAIRLAGYRLLQDSWVPGGALQLALYWQALEKPDRDYTVFAHVLDGMGQTVAQRDAMPGDNSLPTTQWRPGELIEDIHLIPLPGDLPSGEYRLLLGIYYWETMERLPILGPHGESVPDGAIVLGKSIQVVE